MRVLLLSRIELSVEQCDTNRKRAATMHNQEFGETGLTIPRIVYGTSCLGNLYEAIPDATKLAISREWFAHHALPAVIDTAGKYGAGLALEVIGRNLRQLDIPPEQVVISNKLGWKRVPLQSPEPTFEKGVWADLEYDAEQCISYNGILDCWEQGCELIGEGYRPQLLSVHDPDEYLAAASSQGEREKRFDDIIEAYKALHMLKSKGQTQAIGVGSKDWQLIAELESAVELDWVMFANSLTIYRHPADLLQFIARLTEKKIGVINSAVFNAGFLIGGKYFDYRIPSVDNQADREVIVWRDEFLDLCKRQDVLPATACIQFGLSPPGVAAIALNTSEPERVEQNVAAVEASIGSEFWEEAKQLGLVAADYSYV